MSTTDPKHTPGADTTPPSSEAKPKRKAREPAASKKAPKTASPAPGKNPDALDLWREDGRSRASMLAQFALSPEFSNASTFKDFSAHLWGRENLHLTEIVGQLMRQSENAQKGDLSRAEGLLTIQAHTLDAIFNSMARRAAENAGTYLGATETYLRLALKAQSQCRSTLEALAEIKNPRAVAFVRAEQANIAQGHQQVNNGTQAAARVENQTSPIELLEAPRNDLDTATPATAIGIDPAMATLDRQHRTADSAGEGR
jgi:hypothetical protein